MKAGEGGRDRETERVGGGESGRGTVPLLHNNYFK